MKQRFELFVLLSFVTAYVVKLFEFSEPQSHHGPLKNQDVRVKRYDLDGEAYDAPTTLIDRVRQRTPLNPYIVRGDEWIIDTERMEVWECPKCLTPYAAFAVTVPFMLLYGRWRDIPLMLPAVAGGGYTLYSMFHYFWNSTTPVIAAFEEDTEE